jgi:hypothetical protein
VVAGARVVPTERPLLGGWMHKFNVDRRRDGQKSFEMHWKCSEIIGQSHAKEVNLHTKELILNSFATLLLAKELI